jgi:UDPglucose 6-dehydrogenase
MNFKIASIGYGFVGKALCNSFRTKNIEILVNDINFQDCDNLYKFIDDVIKENEKMNETPIYFICVPTPMMIDGKCNTEIVESVIKDIKKFSTKKPIIVIKSTVPPTTTQMLADKYDMNICFNPEFLTEKNSFYDFENQSIILLGTTKNNDIQPVIDIYKHVFPEVPIKIDDSITMEYVKYMKNCFLATKVIFANVFRDLCNKTNTDYNRVKELVAEDNRILGSHLDVPGHDGYDGFGGTCFPKDLNAIINFGEEKGANVNLLKSIWENNLIFRNKNKEKIFTKCTII